MSLHVSLEGPNYKETVLCSECGTEREAKRCDFYYTSNITHNVIRMASEAGIYGLVWRPEEHEITTARQLIEPLRTAIKLMVADKPRFEQYDARNGWGTYKQFLPWLREYLYACETYPDATVRVSR